MLKSPLGVDLEAGTRTGSTELSLVKHSSICCDLRRLATNEPRSQRSYTSQVHASNGVYLEHTALFRSILSQAKL